MDVLKPCPFCGCEAIITEIPPHKHALATFMPDYEGSATVECCLCGAALIKTTKDEAIKAWNRRANIDVIPVEWLEAKKTEYLDDWGEEPVSVEAALRIWQKEQEARQ